ncbi:MAG: hypothetical protein ACOYMN_02375 [Roseimicrobium sp.]
MSNRLLAAAGKALIEAPLDVAGAGVELLEKNTGAVGETAKRVGDGAAEAGANVLQGGKDIIKGTGEAAGKAFETGVGALKGLFGK